MKSSSTIKKGKTSARDISVPATDKDGKKVSRHARTILEASATPDKYVSPIMADIEAGKCSYDVITDEKVQRNEFVPCRCMLTAKNRKLTFMQSVDCNFIKNVL